MFRRLVCPNILFPENLADAHHLAREPPRLVRFRRHIGPLPCVQFGTSLSSTSSRTRSVESSAMEIAGEPNCEEMLSPECRSFRRITPLMGARMFIFQETPGLPQAGRDPLPEVLYRSAQRGAKPDGTPRAQPGTAVGSASSRGMTLHLQADRSSWIRLLLDRDGLQLEMAAAQERCRSDEFPRWQVLGREVAFVNRIEFVEE
jgi:hypothetical protein